MFLPAGEVKYYLYISDSKLQMLYEQVADADAHRRSVEWKADAKLASVTRKTETEKKPTRDKRLQTVVNALRERNLIGTIDEPDEYFEGRLPMRWGFFSDQGRPSDEAPLVYFGGSTDNTLFGLGGSSRHVLGFEGATSTGSRSSAPYLVRALLQGMGMSRKGWNECGGYRTESLHEDHVLDAVEWATSYLRPPDQNLEFVAKTLLQGTAERESIDSDEEVHCVLGTPLYVAMVDFYHGDRL